MQIVPGQEKVRFRIANCLPLGGSTLTWTPRVSKGGDQRTVGKGTDHKACLPTRVWVPRAHMVDEKSVLSQVVLHTCTHPHPYTVSCKSIILKKAPDMQVKVKDRHIINCRF